MNGSQRWRRLCFGSVSAGLAICTYLLIETFILLSDDGSDVVDLCLTVFGASCNEALSDTRFWMFGMPPAAWGVVYFSAIAYVFVVAPIIGGEYLRWSAISVLLISALGAVISLVSVAVMIIGRATFCPLCASVHLLNTILVVAAWRHALSIGKSQNAKKVFGVTIIPIGDVRSLFMGVVGSLMFSIIIYQAIVIQLDRRLNQINVTDQVQDAVNDWILQKPQSVAVRDDDPRAGSANAPVQIVIFSDFQCPGCGEASKLLDEIANAHAGAVSIVFKHFPLSTRCNSRVRLDMHRIACDAAFAAQAAHGQSRFWEFHNALFQIDLEAAANPSAAFREIASRLGLDLDRFERDLGSVSTRRQIEEDVAVGAALHVRGTPTAFVNGKPIQRLSRTVLEALIEIELHRLGGTL